MSNLNTGLNSGLKSELFQYFLLNLCAAFLCSATHNALYFLIGLTTWHVHFLHYAVTFAVLFLAKFLPNAKCGSINNEKNINNNNNWRNLLFQRKYLPVALSQFCVTLCTAACHSLKREGSLYLLRLQDFFVTAFILLILQRDTHMLEKRRRNFLLVLGFSASLSWLEFGILDFDTLGLIASPFNIVAQAYHIVITQRIYKEESKQLHHHKDVFIMQICALTSCFLAPVALCLLLANVGEFHETLTQSVAFESIDLLLLGTAVIFLFGLTYSKYWLLLTLSPGDYLAYRHLKYTLASCGQWFLQNMAHATVYSSCGKLLAFSAAWCYIAEKFRTSIIGTDSTVIRKNGNGDKVI